MKTVAIFIAFLNFTIFIIGAFTVFSKPEEKEKSRAISSFIILFCMVYLLILALVSHSGSTQYIVLGLVLNLASICLFFYTTKTVRQYQFSPIFSRDTPLTIITQGPYRFVRHPFYTSYLLAFCAAAMYTHSLLALPAILVIYTIYLHASQQEESKFFHSELKDDYLDYMQRVGRLCPRLFFG